MGKISNGSVKFGRTLKTGDFENKRADVELAFTVDEGEDYIPILEGAAREAHQRVHQMLGIKLAPAEKTEPVASAAKASVPETPTRGKPGPKPKPKPELTPAEVAAAKAAAVADDSLDIPAGLRREPPVPKPAEVAVDELGEFNEDAVESQPDISDQEMSSEMNRAVARLSPVHAGASPKLIKALIGKFVEPPKKSHDIPQTLRRKFLEELAALK